MAALAVHTVLSEMPVILLMAGVALLRHLDRARRVAVAVRALQLGVRSEQREMCLPGVIEAPQRPAVRRMAAFALVAQAALVHVIVCVAGDAGGGRGAEGQRGMALRTADDAVQTQQREAGHIVIEYHIGSPAVLPVTVTAAALELGAVRILAAMAVGAVLAELLGRDGRGMAGCRRRGARARPATQIGAARCDRSCPPASDCCRGRSSHWLPKRSACASSARWQPAQSFGILSL